jgi:hypothetical protein
MATEKTAPKKATDKRTAAKKEVAKNTPQRKEGAKKSPENCTKQQSTTEMEKLPSLKSVPNWEDWSRRHTISIFDAICLVHNLLPNAKQVQLLKEKKDVRLKKFETHLKTLKDNVRHNPKLALEISDKKSKPYNATRIFLKTYIDWVKANKPFPILEIPREFFEITPLTAQDGTVDKNAGSNQSVAVKNSTKSERLNKTWARIMVALAVKHHGFKPMWPTSELKKSKKVSGLYGPIAKHCDQLGLTGSTHRTTVRDAFIDALETIGESSVKGMMGTIDSQKKSA